MMSSRQSLGVPVLHAQQWKDRTWRGRACQRTRRTRQLGENDSRGSVGAVSGERVDAGHHGGEHRRGENGCRHGHHRTQDRADRTTRSTGAALVLAGIADLGRRRENGRGGCVFICRSRSLGMLVLCRSDAVVMRVVGRSGGLHLGGCTGAVVIGSTKRHGRYSSTLRGDCQHQQPHQKRSNEGHHRRIIAGTDTRVGRMANGLIPVHRSRPRLDAQPASAGSCRRRGGAGHRR